MENFKYSINHIQISSASLIHTVSVVLSKRSPSRYLRRRLRKKIFWKLKNKNCLSVHANINGERDTAKNKSKKSFRWFVSLHLTQKCQKALYTSDCMTFWKENIFCWKNENINGRAFKKFLRMRQKAYF